MEHVIRVTKRVTTYYAKKVQVAGPIGGFFFLELRQPIGRTDWTCLNTSRNPKKLVTRVNFVANGGDLWKQNKNGREKLKI
jgi:hypothetical protein